MKNLEWFYPEDANRAAELAMREGFIPHGGSTGLLMRKEIDAKAIVDLANAGLDKFNQKNGKIEIGAMMTYAELNEIMRKLDPLSIIHKALNGAVPNGLMNRITTGGSVAMFPIWSDIMGPFIALEAKVDILGKNSGQYDIEEYIENRDLHDGSIITKITIPGKRFFTDYFRQRRTEFDYNAFSITFIAGVEGNKCIDTKIVVVGCKGKYKRLEKLENHINGKAQGFGEIDGLIDDLEFPNKPHGSGEYLLHLCKTALSRIVENIEAKGGCR
ncbi:MAG: FAD binding domain-containing protein [Candidatus Zixiibacteriota bacterium]